MLVVVLFTLVFMGNLCRHGGFLDKYLTIQTEQRDGDEEMEHEEDEATPQPQPVPIPRPFQFTKPGADLFEQYDLAVHQGAIFENTLPVGYASGLDGLLLGTLDKDESVGAQKLVRCRPAVDSESCPISGWADWCEDQRTAALFDKVFPWGVCRSTTYSLSGARIPDAERITFRRICSRAIIKVFQNIRMPHIKHRLRYVRPGSAAFDLHIQP